MPYSRYSESVSDGSLIAKSVSDPGAFGELFDRHIGAVHSYLARRVGREEADVLAAEVFRIAFEKRVSYETGKANALPWLYGISYRLLLKHYRSASRKQAAIDRLKGLRPSEIDMTEQVEAAMIAENTWSSVSQCLVRLSEGDRQVLLLYSWEELSYVEIAETLDLPVGTVRSRLNRARKKINELLGSSGGELANSKVDEGTQNG